MTHDTLTLLNFVVTVAAVPVVLLVVFFVIRRFWLWYFKIDERVALMEATVAELRRLNGPEELGVPVPNPQAWQRPPGWLPPGSSPTP